MRTIVLALAVAAAPAMALACDSPTDSNSATFILQDGGATRLIGSVADLKRIKSKLRGPGPALFVWMDGKEYVIDDVATVDRARTIFQRSDPTDAKQEALERDAEERALDLRQEELDAVQDEASTQMELGLEKLAREAIRAGKVRS